jgi:signal peptidase II
MTKKTIILWIICLVIVDQVIKLIVANYLFDTKFDIIDSILGFHPIYNNKYSYFNALLKLNLGLLPHTILLFFIECLLLLFYGYFKTMQYSTKLIDIAFILGQAALVCVFCGFFFWENGILDFIFLYPFIVDFKDIYLNGFVIFFFWNYFKNYSEIKSSNVKMTNYLKDF